MLEQVVFDKKSAPFEAQFTIQEHAQKHQNQLPAAADTVLESTYMDDSMDSTGEEQNAILLYRQLSQPLENAGMHARKWLRNSTHVLKEVHQEDHLSKVDFNQRRLMEWFRLLKLMCLHSRPNRHKATFL